MGQRETALQALLSFVTNNVPTYAVGSFSSWASAPSRRLKLWADVPLQQRPCCFIFEGGEETHTYTNSYDPRRTLNVKLFVYINSKEKGIIGSALLNDIMDTFDAAFVPSGSDINLGRNTLNGTVFNARILGSTLKDPGDIDGDGMLVIPVNIILP